MKKLMIFAAGLLLSMSARSQILKPVKWSYAAKKTSATTATVFIKATIQEGWHVYGLTVPEGGPVKTTFTFIPSNTFSTIGAITAPKPTIKFEKTFNMNVNFFEKEVIFQQKVKLKGADAEVKGTVEFMVCSDRQCLPPETTAFSIPIK